MVSRFLHRKVRSFLHPCFSLWVKVGVLQPVGFPAERVALGMVQDPVQHRSGKYRITHHISPVNDLFVGGKDNGTGFIGITDKCEKPVCLSAADRCITDLINDDKLCFLDIFESESGCTLCFCGVENLNQAGHLLKTYSIAAVDSLQAKTTGNHGLAEARRSRKDKASAVIYLQVNTDQPIAFYKGINTIYLNTLLLLH